jgi:uncharacterized protein YkwD
MDVRRHRLPLSVFATVLLASLAVAAPAAQAATCAGADALPLLATVGSAKAATLCLLNDQRAANGLAPLASEPTLDAVASDYAATMVAQRFFAHVTPAGGTLDQRLAAYTTGTRGFGIGENLAWGGGVLGTPRATVNAWMSSPGHRDNILDTSFQQIGVGIAAGTPVGGLPGVGATYATEFGYRQLAGAPSPTTASASTVSVNVTPRATKKAKSKLKPLSAKTKRRISKACHKVARRAKGSAKTRRARYDRCVRTRTRAARTAAR